ncbi:LppU/SCO3897 family protein [Crossiella cryophila]|uniref:Uncharacterized protein YpmB n=1 Tax=Crossiella cryophila TaxID=43355 RepID=A0A7W7CJ17_9PSEU|nr:hypothetical protein [Crossiella cryophila]MBB4682065.1 uncharacterized protein YpmB [Crossiella cryophila]
MTNPQANAPQDQPIQPAGEQPAAPKKKKSVLPKVLGILLVVLVAGGFAVYRYMNSAQSAKVGECIAAKVEGEKVNSANKVDCGNADAQYKVVGKYEDKKEADFKIELCEPHADTTDAIWVPEGRSGATGTVLCLTANKK